MKAVSGSKNGGRVDGIDANHGSCWATLARLATTTTSLTITSAPPASRRSGSMEAGTIGAADDATVEDRPAASSIAAHIRLSYHLYDWKHSVQASPQPSRASSRRRWPGVCGGGARAAVAAFEAAIENMEAERRTIRVQGRLEGRPEGGPNHPLKITCAPEGGYAGWRARRSGKAVLRF